MTLVRWTLSFLGPYRARISVIAALSVLGIGLTALAPWALKLVVDNVLGGQRFPDAIAAIPPSEVQSAIQIGPSHVAPRSVE